MGIFDFVQDAGEKVEAAEEAALATSLMGLVAEHGFEVQDLLIEFDDGVATVTGRAPDADTRDEVVLLVGNVEGVRQVDDRLEVPAAPEPVFYTVVKGDSLWRIAKQYLGEGRRYPEIVAANKAVLKGSETIHPGYVLRIPTPAGEA